MVVLMMHDDRLSCFVKFDDENKKRHRVVINSSLGPDCQTLLHLLRCHPMGAAGLCEKLISIISIILHGRDGIHSALITMLRATWGLDPESSFEQ